MERSKLKVPAGSDVPTASESAPAEAAEPLDPRSYLAKSVPERMAIISAGVIMNLIFAVIFAAVAYKMGVKYTVCGVSSVTPGDAAWRAGFQPGDRIVQIGEEGQQDPHLRFVDLFAGVALGNLNDGLKLKVERDDSQQPFWVTVYPDPKKAGVGRPTIGAVPPLTRRSTRPSPHCRSPPPDRPRSSRGGTESFRPMAGKSATTATGWRCSPRRSTSRSKSPPSTSRPTGRSKTSTDRVTATVAPNPMRDFGLIMTIGPIKAVQEKSPAAEAGLLAGDRIVAIDGQPVGDPLAWPQQLARSRATQVRLTVERTGKAAGAEQTPPVETLEKTLDVRPVDWFEDTASAVSVPQLGLAYTVDALVREVHPNGAANGAGIIPGDRVVNVRVLPYIDPATQEKRSARRSHSSSPPSSRVGRLSSTTCNFSPGRAGEVHAAKRRQIARA